MIENINSKKKDSNNFENLNIFELIKIIWFKKFQIVAITFLIALASIIYALSLDNYYESSATTQTSGNNNNLMSGYTGIAAIAGINLPQETTNYRDLSIEIAQSRDFLKLLISNYNNITQMLIAVDYYDVDKKAIIFNKNLYNESNNNWVNGEPKFIDTYKAFRNIVSISYNKKTEFITISAEHQSPEFAQFLVNIMIKEINNIIRENDLIESVSALDFLNTEYKNSKINPVKVSISTLIESQLRKKMMTEIRVEYALKIVDSAFLPEEKSKPARGSMVIIYSFIGFLLSLILIIFLEVYKRIYKK
jgi:uncharacterized protein involved in exopolysaccharide biosynthesis